MLSLAIAFATHSYGRTASYAQKIETLRSLELGWIYLGVITLKFCYVGLGINAACARKAAKVLLASHSVWSYLAAETKIAEGELSLKYC